LAVTSTSTDQNIVRAWDAAFSIHTRPPARALSTGPRLAWRAVRKLRWRSGGSIDRNGGITRVHARPSEGGIHHGYDSSPVVQRERHLLRCRSRFASSLNSIRKYETVCPARSRQPGGGVVTSCVSDRGVLQQAPEDPLPEHLVQVLPMIDHLSLDQALRGVFSPSNHMRRQSSNCSRTRSPAC